MNQWTIADMFTYTLASFAGQRPRSEYKRHTDSGSTTTGAIRGGQRTRLAAEDVGSRRLSDLISP